MGKKINRGIAGNHSNFISQHYHLEHIFTRPLVPLPSGEHVPPWITLITALKCSHWLGKLRQGPLLQLTQKIAGQARKQTHVKNYALEKGSRPTSTDKYHISCCECNFTMLHITFLWCCLDIVRLWSFSQESVVYESERKVKKLKATDLEAKGARTKEDEWWAV